MRGLNQIYNGNKGIVTVVHYEPQFDCRVCHQNGKKGVDSDDNADDGYFFLSRRESRSNSNKP